MTSEVTDKSFQTEVLGADGPVLVDFWAPWCPPCRQMSPIVDELSAELDGVKVVKLNVDDNPQTAARYGVRSIPTFNVYFGGELVETVVGGRPKKELAALASKYVSQ